MLSVSLCGVGPANLGRITLLAKFTPHKYSAALVSGTCAQRSSRLAGFMLRAFGLAAGRCVPPPDRHRIVRAGCRRVAPVGRGSGARPLGLASVAVAGLVPDSGPGTPRGALLPLPGILGGEARRAGFKARSRSLARFASRCSRASPGCQAQASDRHPTAACQRHPRPSNSAPCRAAGRACGHGRPL